MKVKLIRWWEVRVWRLRLRGGNWNWSRRRSRRRRGRQAPWCGGSELARKSLQTIALERARWSLQKNFSFYDVWKGDLWCWEHCILCSLDFSSGRRIVVLFSWLVEDDPRLEDFREVSYYIAVAKFAKLNKRKGSCTSRRWWLVPAAGRGRRQQAGKMTPSLL